MSSIPRQIILSVAYAQQFSFPLKVSEVWQRLLVSTTGSEVVERNSFVTAVLALVTTKTLGYKTGYLFIADKDEIVSIRQKRLETSLKKRRELKPLLQMCSWLPWVCGVAITGSLAMNNADARADADVMIITENNRLWLVRPLLVLYSFLYGKRRSWNKEEENSWCLNLWLERDSLSVPLSQRSVYTAHEVIQADWQLSKAGAAQEFYLANRWVKNYFYHTAKSKVTDQFGGFSIPLLTQLLNVCNNLAYQLQKWYMKPHMTKERVQLSSAFFHPRDTKLWIVTSWKKVIESI